MSEDKSKDFLTLKWGSIKSYKFESEKATKGGAAKLLEEFYKDGYPLSLAMENVTSEQKNILCKLIDIGDFEKVFLDWNGRYLSKEKAKKYVMNYNKQAKED